MTHYCSLLSQWALRISQKAPSLNIKTQCTGTNCYNAKKSSKVISTHFTKIAGWEWGSRQFTKYCFAVPQRFFNSIVHLHHNLAKAVYRAENYRNLVELLVSDKADLITILVHFCYPRDWQFSDKPCRSNGFFGGSRNSVSRKSIWHYHRTRQYQSNIRLHIWNTSRDQHFRSHGSRSDHWIWDPESYGRIWYPCPWVLHRRSFCLHRHRTRGDRFWHRDFSVYCTTKVSASKATGW